MLDVATVISARLSTLAHSTEDKEKVMKSFQAICSSVLPGKIETARLRGHYGNEIVAFRVHVRPRKQAERFFVHIWSRLSSLDRDEIMLNLQEYVDASGTLYLRIGKQESYKGAVTLLNSDPIKVEVQFATRRPQEDSLMTRIRSRMNAPSP